MILGIDEVGRGPWAGPMVVGAVVLPENHTLQGLTDSKKLTKKKREKLAPEIMSQAIDWALGWVSAREIDELGLSSALKLACRRAVEQISSPYHEIIIDGTINLLEGTGKADYVTLLKKADLLIPSVSAASIIAKVARDNYMAKLDERFPGYDFASNAGYGTAKHIAAIDRLGVSPQHRLSFAPLVKYQQTVMQKRNAIKAQTTRQIGDAGETVAAEELKLRGHTILERNWRTKYCEIDIVSREGGTIYFTEVKHRKNAGFGDGLAAITPKKLEQMKYAARFYAHANHLENTNLRLIAIATSGENPAVEQVILL